MKILRAFILFFALVSIILPRMVFAVQGTCSYHGGVNCSLGADWDGSAVCNDGWRDSSERFYEVKKCMQDLHYCSTEEFAQIRKKYNLDEQYKAMDELGNKISTISTYSQDTSESLLRKNYLESSKIYQQWLLLDSKYKQDDNFAMQECFSLGNKSYYNTMAEITRKQAETLYGTQTKTQAAIVPTLIEGGYIRGTELFCDNGYNKDTANLKCIRDGLVAICSQSSNSNGNITTCSCSIGYKWVGGTTCKKYNIQTGEFVEDVSNSTQTSVSTSTKLNNANIPTFTRILKKGMSSEDVKRLQILLQKLKYLPSSHTPSIYFGSVTSNALMRFQKDNKIQPVSGALDLLTFSKILAQIK